MNYILDSKQQEGFEKFQKLRVGAFFTDTGGGKTLPAYKWAEDIKDSDFILYLAPFQAIWNKETTENIRKEIEKYGGFSKDHKFLGMESLSNSPRIYLETYDQLLNAVNPIIIADESILFKNKNAKRTQRIFEFKKLSKYRMILNGTPISKNLLDLKPQIDFLDERIINMSDAEFTNTFCEYTTMKKRIGNKITSRTWINKFHNLEYLYSLIKPYVFDANFELNIDIQYIDIDFVLDEEMKDEYQCIKEKYLDDEVLMALNNNIFLSMTEKMRKMYATSSDKFEILKKIIDDNPESKIIVVRWYTNSEDELKKRFGDRILLLSYGKHSKSLNLQEYDIMILWDKIWDYEKNYQIIRRIARRGRIGGVRIFRFNGNVNLEKMILENLDKKGKLLNKFKSYSVEQLKNVL